MNKIRKTKIYHGIRFFIDLNKKYEITLIASSICFYIILSVIIVFVLGFQFVNTVSHTVNSFLIGKIISLLNEDVLSSFKNFIPAFTLNSSSIFLLFGLIWSASKVVNGFIKGTNKIYQEHSNSIYNRFIYNRVYAVIIVIFILFFIIFEILFMTFGNYLIFKYLSKYKIIIKLLQIIIEMVFLFLLLLILNLFVVPGKIKVKEVYKGVILSTLIIYLLMEIFVLFINVLNKINYIYSYSFFISLSSLLLFFSVYATFLGIVYNHFLLMSLIKSKKIVNHNSVNTRGD